MTTLFVPAKKMKIQTTQNNLVTDASITMTGAPLRWPGTYFHFPPLTGYKGEKKLLFRADLFFELCDLDFDAGCRAVGPGVHGMDRTIDYL
jgi:hypothetical protein